MTDRRLRDCYQSHKTKVNVADKWVDHSITIVSCSSHEMVTYVIVDEEVPFCAHNNEKK